ncbi:glycosyltransferase [Halioxenophilus sp. WMMB6]|uniref:glycosyltransferase n=1 Tax=Halioxenophilus sp. WMMB6 TaxID=3073815 RepID=UPI00295F49F5|nr:glycosyltransferase [Halioxenophilus sp. WMMB6]
MNYIDVIVPVYQGLEETQECILSALRTIDKTIGQLIVINDCSPDPALSQWLRDASASNEFLLLENEHNLGFVGTVNRGMQLNPEHDVVLLNSDVEVAGDWLTRMRTAANRHPKIASITPFSNNATICSFPNFCEDNVLPFGLDVEALHTHFSALFDGQEPLTIPSGIGFCMYMRRKAITEIGYFDEKTFGRGYGEENDWCHRVEKAGWLNSLQTDIFAYHKGGVSFADEQNERKHTAMKLINKLHPNYEPGVHAFIKRDPIKSFRLQALWKLVAEQSKRKLLHISHRLGGGVQQHVIELSELYQDDTISLLLTPEQDGESVVVSVLQNSSSCKDSLVFQAVEEYDDLLRLLKSVGVSYVHFHHTMGLHPKLWQLAQDINCPYDFTVHDYYCINGNPTLIDENARYCGHLPTREMDAACHKAYPIPVSAEQWRINQQPILVNAERVIYPSLDTKLRFEQYFSLPQGLAAWHPDYAQAAPYPDPEFNFAKGEKLKVLVLGAISREKGADMLEAVAKQLPNCQFELLGYAYRALDSKVVTHGPYEQSAVQALIKAIAPQVIWFPCSWPETYSYTLSTALQMGLPVVAPDIGAFAERLLNRPYSITLPWDYSVNEWLQFWQTLQSEGSFPRWQPQPELDTAAIHTHFYEAEYQSGVVVKPGDASALNSELLTSHYKFQTQALNLKEKLLRSVWGISRLPIIGRLVNLLPFEFKRAFKRALSARPIHDIVNHE